MGKSESLHIDNNKEILYTYDVNGIILTKTIDGENVEYTLRKKGLC